MREAPSSSPTVVLAPVRWKALMALGVPILLSAAFAFSYLQPISGVPGAVRYAVHGTLVPLLAVVLLRQPLPELCLSRSHASLALIALVFTGGSTLIGGRIGFERVYSELIAALVITGWTILALVTVLVMRARPNTRPGLSGWWQILAALIVAFVFANPADGSLGVFPELMTNFVLVGMTEEFAFRGVIQGFLLQRWRGQWFGLSSANWATAVLFAWIHNPTFAHNHLAWFVYLVPSGLFFGALRDRSGSWLLPGLAHGLVSPTLYAWSLLGFVSLPSP